MDRNINAEKLVDPLAVALRKESVDRNGMLAVQVFHEPWVALRKESVDRNCKMAAR